MQIGLAVPDSPEQDLRTARYNPLLIAAVVLIGGVCIDRNFEIPGTAWLILSIFFLVVWACCVSLNRPIISTCISALVILCFGGLRHHVYWNDYRSDDISRFVASGEKDLQVECVATSEARWVPPRPDDPMDVFASEGYAILQVRIEKLRDVDRFIPASGKCQLIVRGDSVSIAAGDRLKVLALCAPIETAGNPGEFDLQNHFRGQRQLVSLSASSAESIDVISTGSSLLPNRWISQLRITLNEKLKHHLSSENGPLAAAIMLGYREQIDRAQRDQFMLTGTVHLLAISGLHVGILSAILIWLGRIGIVNNRLMLVLTILFVVFYAWLVGFRPPVTRAAILVVLYCIAKWSGRKPWTINTLAAAALIVFAINPCDIFNIGAQLSFAAVAIITLGQKLFISSEPRDPLDELIRRASPWPIKVWRYLKELLWNSFLVSVLIWLGSAVLIAHYFHLVTPAALICNPLLVIPITLALVSGLLLLTLGSLVPPLAVLFGFICDQSLWAMNEIIELGNLIPFGSWWTCGPGLPAVLFFYLMIVVCAIYPPTRIPIRWTGAFALVWLTFVIAFAPGMHRPNHLRITVLDVGHGSCTIVEFKNGKVMLFDAGASGSRDRTTDIICRALWRRGISRIDTMVVSHADVDHYNAIPGIAERFSIGQVLVSHPMLQSRSRAVAELFRIIKNENIPVAAIQIGDEIAVDPETKINILHPGMESTKAGDNSDSVAIEIQHASYSVLLPGDLELTGLSWLLSHYSKDFDMVVAPHHGSKNSLPLEFVNWSNPEHVVISADKTKVPTIWNSIESKKRKVWQTGIGGAITASFPDEGIEVAPFRK